MHETKFDSKDFTDEQLVNASTETMGGHPSQKSLWAQSELTRRLMDTMKKFDTATTAYSEKLLNLSLVMMLIAMAQLMVSVFSLPVAQWVQVVIWLGLVCFILYEVRSLTHK